MYIYTYTGHAKTPEDAQRICGIFGRLLSLVYEPGYRRGECAVDTDDSRQVFIHEHWGSLHSLRAWLDSPAHHKAMDQIEPLLENGHFESHLYQALTGGPP